jgi:hypothetical protein
MGVEVEANALITCKHWEKIKGLLPENADDKKAGSMVVQDTGGIAQTAWGSAECPCELKAKKTDSTAKWRCWISPYDP